MNWSWRIEVLSADKTSVNLIFWVHFKKQKTYGLHYLIIPSPQASPKNLVWIMLWGNIFRFSLEHAMYTSQMPARCAWCVYRGKEISSEGSPLAWECRLLPSPLTSHLVLRTSCNVTGFEAIPNSLRYPARRYTCISSDHFFCISLTTLEIFFLEWNPKAETAP